MYVQWENISTNSGEVASTSIIINPESDIINGSIVNIPMIITSSSSFEQIVNLAVQVGEVLVGSTIWTSDQTEISAIMSIDLSQFGGPILNGAIDGNSIMIKIYNVSENIEYQSVVASITTGGEFGDLFTVISELELSDPVDVVLGCTDESSCNYNSDATHDDGSCEPDDCEVYIELELTTTVDESELEDMDAFEENFESLIETELDLPEGSVEVTEVTVTETRDIEVTIDFTITLTEDELADTDFESEEDLNGAWEEVEDEIDDGLPSFVEGSPDLTKLWVEMEGWDRPE